MQEIAEINTRLEGTQANVPRSDLAAATQAQCSGCPHTAWGKNLHVTRPRRFHLSIDGEEQIASAEGGWWGGGGI
ncbi:hypothetical protein BaRGS_00020009, partial [Batillaria attramentaria]